ncbi:protein SCO1/2 [Cupriavidus sp. YR651]|uniref:SCO family protein n=1 Tax=Cupriavidus sp. YR651 TaxID=1855315 RepID=UPI00087EB378|nr:SCO family protein [Cupriavidus sp. YR651]SDB99901.1 protein SCO1/2 [Cupriavidus sp. YR651]
MATWRSAARVASQGLTARHTGRRARHGPWPVVVLLLALALGGAAIWQLTYGLTSWTLDQRREVRIAAGGLQLPAIDVRNQHGEPLRLFADPGAASAPAIYIVDFIYTRCLTVCRALGAEFTQLAHQIDADGMAGRIGLLSMSFDPRDATADLAGYAREHQARLPGWQVVGAVSMASMQTLLRNADIIAIPDGLGGFEHNGGLHVVDASGHVLAVYPLADFRAAYAFARKRAGTGATAATVTTTATGATSATSASIASIASIAAIAAPGATAATGATR